MERGFCGGCTAKGNHVGSVNPEDARLTRTIPPKNGAGAGFSSSLSEVVTLTFVDANGLPSESIRVSVPLEAPASYNEAMSTPPLDDEVLAKTLGAVVADRVAKCVGTGLRTTSNGAQVAVCPALNSGVLEHLMRQH